MPFVLNKFKSKTLRFKLKFGLPFVLKVSVIRKYHNRTLQTNSWHHEEEPQHINSNKTSRLQLKQSNQLSLPSQDDCKTIKAQRIINIKVI